MSASSSSSSSYLSVLRIGPTRGNESAAILKNAVLDHFHNNQDAQQDDNAATTKDGRFQVSNRYFRAKLLLQAVEEEAVTETTQDDTLFHKEDGVILVFDAKTHPDFLTTLSFDSLDIIHNDKVVDKAGELLRLCVGVSLGPFVEQERQGKDYEQEYSRRILWCLDRGYEYVEADLSQEGLTRGHDSRDKEGFARIVEAIAGTVWSSAVMENKKTAQLKQSYQETMKEQQIDNENQQAEENPYIPPDPSLLGSVPLEETAKQQPEHVVLSDEARLEEARKALLSETEKEAGAEEKNSDAATQQEMEQERAFDRLEGALKQAASIREMSKSGKLTDEERRQRAGDAAVLLMNLMSSMGMEDDEDEGEEEDSVLEGENNNNTAEAPASNSTE